MDGGDGECCGCGGDGEDGGCCGGGPLQRLVICCAFVVGTCFTLYIALS